MPIHKQATIALVIAALAVPATSAAFLTVSAAPAFAKGSNGNGNKGGKSTDHAKPGKPSRSASNGNKGGNGNGPSRASNASTVLASSVDTTGSTELTHSQLGSMNGALHANINAVLAHIRNGNTSGPVGSLAGLAVADHNAEGAQEVLDLAAQYDALGAALEDAGYDSLSAYQDAVDAGEIEPIAAIEDARTALGDAVDAEPPTDQEIADATAALAAQQAAEDGMLDAWNKSGTATDDEKATLLQALRDRLDAESDAISRTIGTVETASVTADETVEETPAEE